MQLMKLALCATALALLTACATTTRGTKDVLVVDTNPTGARVAVSNGMVSQSPATFRLPRKGDYVVTIEKEGYEVVRVNVLHKVVAGGSAGMAGNILVGGLIGVAIDASSGAMFDLVPNPIHVTLVPLTQAQVVAATTATIATPPAPPVPKQHYTSAEDRQVASRTVDAMKELATSLMRLRASKGLPDKRTLIELYPELARMGPVRIADHWGMTFLFGKTPGGFMLASAGADRTFDDSSWQSGGESNDFGEDAVLQVEGDTMTFIRSWNTASSPSSP